MMLRESLALRRVDARHELGSGAAWGRLRPAVQSEPRLTSDAHASKVEGRLVSCKHSIVLRAAKSLRFEPRMALGACLIGLGLAGLM